MKPSNPKFSIVTVVLNDLAGLKETQKSVYAQSHQEVEWIVIDSASTDGTPDYLRSLALANLEWLSERDTGIYDGMNKGLDRARGEYVIFMNAGDVFAADTVLEQVARAVSVSGSHDLVFGDALQQTAGGELFLKPARKIEAIMYGMFTHHQAIFYRREAAQKIRYDQRWVIAGDYALTASLFMARASSLKVNLPICVFKEGGLSQKRELLGRREALQVQKTILRVGFAKRKLHHLSFVLSSQLRNHFRPLYNAVRFRSTAPLSAKP
jgi:putative colanic acid biosynthesis glycosyltransferase